VPLRRCRNQRNEQQPDTLDDAQTAAGFMAIPLMAEAARG
jgi:hypothetical protein